MAEKIVNFPITEKEALPFQSRWRNELSVLPDGHIQATLLHPRQGVLHVSPACVEKLNEDEETVCNRWIDPKKGISVASVQNLHTNNSLVIIPKVVMIGEVVVPDKPPFPLWLEEEVYGEPLGQLVLKGEPNLEVYVKLITWIASFHSPVSPKTILRSYYEKRLGSINRIMESDMDLRECLGENRVNAILKLIQSARNNVNLAVDEFELVDRVHGDLRGNNILVEEGKPSVFDFEQGLCGGDWFCDLEKLLLLEKQEQSDPEKPYIYLPNLDLNQKHALADRYANARAIRGWKKPNVMANYLESRDPNKLAKRHQLYEVENVLSILIFRHLMGWSHDVSQDGQKRIGVSFIADLLLQHYNRNTKQ